MKPLQFNSAVLSTYRYTEIMEIQSFESAAPSVYNIICCPEILNVNKNAFSIAITAFAGNSYTSQELPRSYHVHRVAESC